MNISASMALYMTLRKAATYPESWPLREKLNAIAEDFKQMQQSANR